MRLHTGAVRTPLKSLHWKFTLGEKSVAVPGLEPESIFRLAVQSEAVPTELSRSLQSFFLFSFFSLTLLSLAGKYKLSVIQILLVICLRLRILISSRSVRSSWCLIKQLLTLLLVNCVWHFIFRRSKDARSYDRNSPIFSFKQQETSFPDYSVYIQRQRLQMSFFIPRFEGATRNVVVRAILWHAVLKITMAWNKS